MNSQMNLHAPPSSFDPAFALDVMIPLAEATYAAMQDPGNNPPLASFQKTARIQVDETQRQTMLGLPPGPQARLLVGLLEHSSIFGLMGKNQDIKTAFVSFRGTQTPGEWLEDFVAIFEPYKFVAKRVRVLENISWAMRFLRKSDLFNHVEEV